MSRPCLDVVLNLLDHGCDLIPRHRLLNQQAGHDHQSLTLLDVQMQPPPLANDDTSHPSIGTNDATDRA